MVKHLVGIKEASYGIRYLLFISQERLYNNGSGYINEVDKDYLLRSVDSIENIELVNGDIIASYGDLSEFPVLDGNNQVVRNKYSMVITQEILSKEETYYVGVVDGNESEYFDLNRMMIHTKNGIKILNGYWDAKEKKFICKDKYPLYKYINTIQMEMYDRDRFEIGSYTYQYNGIFHKNRDITTCKPKFGSVIIDGWGVAITHPNGYNYNETILSKLFDIKVKRYDNLFYCIDTDIIDIGKIFETLKDEEVRKLRTMFIGTQCIILNITDLIPNESFDFISKVIHQGWLKTSIIIVSKELYAKLIGLDDIELQSLFGIDNKIELKSYKDNDQADKLLSKVRLLGPRNDFTLIVYIGESSDESEDSK